MVSDTLGRLIDTRFGRSGRVAWSTWSIPDHSDLQGFLYVRDGRPGSALTAPRGRFDRSERNCQQLHRLGREHCRSSASACGRRRRQRLLRRRGREALRCRSQCHRLASQRQGHRRASRPRSRDGGRSRSASGEQERGLVCAKGGAIRDKSAGHEPKGTWPPL